MRSSSAFVALLLGASAWAAPELQKKTNSNCKKSVCNADNCLRAVRASSAKPYPSSATADCSSFFMKTVTPCAATATATTTVTVTATPNTIFQTNVIDITDLVTAVQTQTTVVTTIVETSVNIVGTEVDVTNFIVQPTTLTAAAVQKRAISTLPLPAIPTVPALDEVRRAASAVPTSTGTCAATTNAPTAVPTYASACSGTVRYSSACSCAGITAQTTTLRQSTVTTTTTATSTYTPMVNVTLTATSETTVVTTQTAFVPATFETATTVDVASAFTVTTQIVIPTTVIVSPPACSSYNFVVTDGPRAGQFVGSQDPATGNGIVSYGFVFFTDAAGAKPWAINSDQTVSGPGDVFSWVTRNNALYYLLEMNQYSEAAYRINYLHCAVGTGATNYPGAVGLLQCTTDAGTPIYLVSCSNTANYLLQTPNVRAAGNGCYAVNLAAVPAC